LGQGGGSPEIVALDPAIAAAVADHRRLQRVSERSLVPLDPAIAAAVRTHRQSDRISEQSFGHGRIRSAPSVAALASMRSSSPSLGTSIALAVAALAAAIGIGVGLATGTVALGSRLGGWIPRRRRHAEV
jgi:hypothetical protein